MEARADRESDRVVLVACGVVAVACAFLILISGVYANAEVSAGPTGSRNSCGTVWEPNALTTECADALQRRSWTTAVLLGVGSLAAISAVLVAARSPGRARRQLAVAALVVAIVVVAGALLWAGAIDRTVGT